MSSPAQPSDKNKTTFSCLLPRTDRVPSANILITDAQTGGTSAFFAGMDGKRQGNATSGHLSCPSTTENLQCATPPPAGAGLTTPGQLCCPDTNNDMQGCCDPDKFLIDNTHRKFNVDVLPNVFKLRNDTLSNLVSRFTQWQGAANDPCLDVGSEAVTTAPVLDKPAFCAKFKRTLDFIWKEFAPQCPDRGEAADRCIAAAIIGYNLKNSSFDPGACTKCPSNVEGACPRQALEAQRNESVQALQRGLPWTPAVTGAMRDVSRCDVMRQSCILPVVVSPNASSTIGQVPAFWPDTRASTTSIRSRASFTTRAGLAAPGAYSFSIDDFYGNFGGPGPPHHRRRQRHPKELGTAEQGAVRSLQAVSRRPRHRLGSRQGVRS
jgi:hypothetical protein